MHIYIEVSLACKSRRDHYAFSLISNNLSTSRDLLIKPVTHSPLFVCTYCI